MGSNRDWYVVESIKGSEKRINVNNWCLYYDIIRLQNKIYGIIAMLHKVTEPAGVMELRGPAHV